MKVTKKVLLSSAVLAAALSIQFTTLAAGFRQASPGQSLCTSVSTTPHMDGTEPMPPFPG